MNDSGNVKGFTLLVPYRLRWDKVMEFEFFLDPDTSRAHPASSQFKITGRELYEKILDGSAEFRLMDVVIDSKEYWFPRGDSVDEAPLCLLRTMTESVFSARGSELAALHFALTRDRNAAVFYLLEISNARLVSICSFFGVAHDSRPPLVRQYVFSCDKSRLEAYFTAATEHDESAIAVAAISYRRFFRVSESGPYWAVRFALACSRGAPDSASLVLGTSGNDMLVALAELQRFRTAYESRARDQEQQTQLLYQSVNTVGCLLWIVAVLLLAILGTLIYQSVR